jgi:hypothetical protein
MQYGKPLPGDVNKLVINILSLRITPTSVADFIATMQKPKQMFAVALSLSYTGCTT